MRAVVQRVSRACVRVNGREHARIGLGLLVLVGVSASDRLEDARALAKRVAGLRIFEDQHGRMNLDAAAVGGAVLCVSQFTLYADVRRGRRPSFEAAAPALQARPLYEEFVRTITLAGLPCATGIFGAEMEVELVNDGPVTIVVDSSEQGRPRGA